MLAIESSHEIYSEKKKRKQDYEGLDQIHEIYSCCEHTTHHNYSLRLLAQTVTWFLIFFSLYPSYLVLQEES